MSWKTFFQALAASAITGCASSASQTLANNMVVGSKPQWKNVGNSAALGAAIGALAFLAQPQAVVPAVTESKQ